jgi:uroporphyrin-III C-methyltransferase
VIYMGVSGCERIQDELLTGLPAATPVAVIQSASLPTQRHITTTLGALACLRAKPAWPARRSSW